jgi:hypothetical protein
MTASATVPTTDLSGTVTNAQLANSAITINGTSTSLGGSINVGTVTSVTGTSPVVSSGGATPAISMPAATTSVSGYLTSTDWNTFNNKGSGTVTSVSATSPVTSSGGATPNIALPAATTSVSGYLTSTDWNTFNNKGSGTVTSVSGTTGRITSTGGTTPVIDLASGVATAGTTGSSTLIPVVTIDTYGRVTGITTAANPQGTVTSVTGTAPVVSSGGATPAISMAAATGSVNGYLTSTDWTTFNNKGSGTVTAVSVASANGFAGTSSGGATPALTLTTSITGVLKGNGAAISAATSGTDYSAGTSALSTGILKSTTTTGALTIAVAADFPTLNQNTTGTASNVTGTVAIANGGTGQTTRQDAMDALAGAVTSGSYLRGNGTDVVMSAIQAADVPTLNQNTTGTASNVTGTVAIANGGTGQTTAAAAFNALDPMTTTGDMIYSSAANTAARLPVGTTGQVLTVAGGVPTWGTASSSNITALGLYENSATIGADYTIGTGNNAMSAGPITVSTGFTVTVPTGSTWTVV